MVRRLSPKERGRISEALDRFAETPRSFGKSFKFLKGTIPVFGYLAQYRVRAGNDRILYDVDDEKRRVILTYLLNLLARVDQIPGRHIERLEGTPLTLETKHQTLFLSSGA